MADLLLPFQLPFMQNAFLIGLILSVPTALLSCFLVLKGWSLMGDAVSHAVLPGIVVAYVLGLPLLLGAFAAGLSCALLTGWIADNSRVKRDTVMGVVFSGMFGMGMVLFVAIETDQHLNHILFGNILGVEPKDLWVAGVVSALVGGAVLLLWRDLLLHAFDPAQAQVSGLRVGWLHYGLLVALSLTIVATLAAAGVILAVGLLIAPGAIAFLTVRSFAHMLPVAVLSSALALVGGIYASFWLDSAPAPTVVLILTAMFVVAFTLRLFINRRRSSAQHGAI